MTGRPKYKFVDPIIETGMVMNVNLSSYSVDVWTQNSGRRYLDIPISSPYVHTHSGEGIYVMPEVGTGVWICVPSEPDSRPFVLGFGAIWNTDGSYRLSRPDLSPGDIRLGGRDGNQVWLRRGGIIQIEATPLAQRMYLPVGNLIRDLCEVYELRTFAGKMEWAVDRSESTTTGDRPTRAVLHAKSVADDPDPVAELTLGDVPGTDDYLHLQIFSNGSSSRVSKAELAIDKQGKVTWTVGHNWSSTVEGEWSTSAKGEVLLESTTKWMSLKAKQYIQTTSEEFRVSAKRIQLGDGGAALDASVQPTGVSVKLAGGGSRAVKGESLVQTLTPLITALSALTPSAASTTAVGNAATALLTQLPGTLSSKVQIG